MAVLRPAVDEWLRGRDTRALLLQQAEVFADNETLPELVRQVYTHRMRPETEQAE